MILCDCYQRQIKPTAVAFPPPPAVLFLLQQLPLLLLVLLLLLLQLLPLVLLQLDPTTSVFVHLYVNADAACSALKLKMRTRKKRQHHRAHRVPYWIWRQSDHSAETNGNITGSVCFLLNVRDTRCRCRRCLFLTLSFIKFWIIVPVNKVMTYNNTICC